MSHFMIDFETIGTNAREIPAIDCSYIVWDWNRFASERPIILKNLLKICKPQSLILKIK
jgi:hypothetical protein